MKLVKDTEKDLKYSKKISEKEAEEAFAKIIKWVGEDPSREGLLSTPKRLVKAYKEYLADFFADYTKNQANRTQEEINEQRSEARAAMGPGVEMVNIITGEKYTT